MTYWRCMYCYPVGDSPTQTEHMLPHLLLVARCADGHVGPGVTCATCHHAANYDIAGVPGHTDWHLAPLSMGWQGRSLPQICEQIKDRARNGGRDMAALVRHMAEDSLVGWAWSPGAGRAPAPGRAGGVRRAGAGLGRRRRRLPAAVRPRRGLWRDFDDCVLAAV